MAGRAELAAAFVVLFLATVCQCEDVTLNTTLGLITGKRFKVHAVDIHAFLGIPYAEPPTGQWRFAPPVEKVVWPKWISSGEKMNTSGNVTQSPPVAFKLNATSYGPACPQPVGNKWMERVLPGFNNYHENCLTLNIFRRADASAGTPVLVFIHGGEWQYGAAQMYDGSFLSTKGFIVVTLNYRLGPLGFLSTGESKTTWAGNYGLLDQVVALKWIKDNIADYHGDPAKITVAGNEVGAASATLHMMSPLSGQTGLFSKVIAMSGMAPFHRAAWNNPRVQPAKWATALAANVSCPQAPGAELIKCLRGKPAEALVSVNLKSGIPAFPAVWRPLPDGSFLTGSPSKLWEQGKFKAMPMLAGRLAVPDVSGTYTGEMGMRVEKYEAAISNLAEKLYPKVAEPFKNAVLYQYRDWNKPNDNITLARQYRQLLADMEYSGAVKAYTVYYQKTANTSLYVYNLNHRLQNDQSQAYLGMRPGDDALLLFGTQPHGVTWTSQDNTVRNNMIMLWKDFIMTGNPSTTSGIQWAPFTDKAQQYLELTQTPKMASKYRAPQMAFWNIYKPEVILSGMPPSPEPETTAEPTGDPKGEPEPGPYFVATWALVGVSALLLILLIILCAVSHKKSQDSYDLRQNGSVKYVA